MQINLEEYNYILKNAFQQIRFYHHIRGKAIGALNVYMRNYINGPLTKLWSKDEAHGNFWVFQHLYLSSSEPFQVRNLQKIEISEKT